ncbi:DNA sulfur modification protein DndD [Mycolicibacterium porcinum]|uniref:DNA sulfur modification protein DndD n=1 Tax=Mycolicibacterium porcinum TaxID=39693 RepID=UPI00080BC1A4|nr:DNA sulfur modification protein DndD [Mycolicibacterium porcinum]OCB14091.1 DNA sulfur modification protein DndD [Mycolicibacterium porcinum]
MILDKLMLHNVGTFAGRHTIELGPRSRTKPIILIGGLNGAGKTTVLESIHLALYGPLAQIPGRRKSGSYENYLRGLIHSGVPHHEGAALELTFRAFQEGKEREFWVRRSWRSTGASIREILLVSVDGQHDEALTSTWNEYVESFLPRGIAGLFIFDGEQIEALADMDRSREVLGSALSALLGIDLIDRLSTDLAVLRRRRQADQVPSKLKETIEERQAAVTAARRDEETASQSLAALRVEVERAEKRAFEVEEQYRIAGGELLGKRDDAEATLARAHDDLQGNESELRNELAGAAPLLQVRDLLNEMLGQAQVEDMARREATILEVVSDRDRAIIELLKKARASAKAIAEVQQFIDIDRLTRETQSTTAEIVGLIDTAALDYAINSALPAAEARLRILTDRGKTLRSDLDQAERVLVAIPDCDALAPLVKERDQVATAMVAARAAQTHSEEHLNVLRQERARADAAYEAALNEAAHTNLALDDGRRIVEHLDRVRVTLGQLRSAASARHLDRISQLILEALNSLLRKENLVTAVDIDPDTHTVQLTGRDGKALPAQDLSAGERQLLAVALLWGLARASGQPLPVVIDTPLGRLDGSHRSHLLDRYFPHASHQVILLSTDTEIDEEAYERISRNVGRSYQLVYDQASNSTSVVDGYFWG